MITQSRDIVIVQLSASLVNDLIGREILEGATHIIFLGCWCDTLT
jgi:hypothetical protein